jgi:hypothetical protein
LNAIPDTTWRAPIDALAGSAVQSAILSPA